METVLGFYQHMGGHEELDCLPPLLERRRHWWGKEGLQQKDI